MTQRTLWTRFASPHGLTGGLAKPNAVLEQIWNTLLRSLLAASSHTFGPLSSEELFPAHRRRQPLQPDAGRPWLRGDLRR